MSAPCRLSSWAASTTVASPMGGGKRKFLRFSKPLAKRNFTAAHDARARYGLVEGNFGRPLRNRVVAFGAFVKANVDFFSRCPSHCGGPGHQEIRQSRGRAPAVITAARFVFFPLKRAVKTKLLLGLEWMACQVRALQVQIMCANAQRAARRTILIKTTESPTS